MRRYTPPRMIELAYGLGLPDYMGFLLEYCKPSRYTKKAVEAGNLLLIDYHPPYVELECNDVDKIVEEARKRKLRVYRGKRHITITDGIYQVRIYLRNA